MFCPLNRRKPSTCKLIVKFGHTGTAYPWAAPSQRKAQTSIAVGVFRKLSVSCAVWVTYGSWLPVFYSGSINKVRSYYVNSATTS